MAGEDKPLKLVHCLTWDVPMVGGVARMDSYFYKFLSRDLVEPVFVATREKDFQKAVYAPISYVYTGLDNRFDKLVELFRDADIVQYYGGFAPVVCEAAKAAGVPALIELMHVFESGLIFDYIDLSICVSETVKKNQPDQKRARVVHNGIDVDEYPFAEERATNEGKIVILQVGYRGKSIIHLDDLADDILALDPRVELWLAGFNQTFASTDRIKYMGVQENMAEIYRSADILFHFTKKEAFGLVVVEAMASGCVPVVSETDGPSEIVTRGVDGFLAPKTDRRAVVAAVSEAVFMIGSERWESIRLAGREKVENRFTIEKCVAEYEKIYIDIITRKGRRSRPGPDKAEPTPEAEIGEAAVFLTNEHWDRAVKHILRMAESTQPIRVPLFGWAVAKVVKHAIFRKRNDLADLIYKKMYVSGFRDAQWMKDWFYITPPGNERKFILAELEKLYPDDPEIVMLMAERSIEAGNLIEALDILEKGALKFPKSDEMLKTCELLKSKIGG
ncbi:MAG TPA: glycosyltransferase [Nitrospirae bacterium]|nr:glycosyltransferase [Nitrospirota bacterium]